MVSGTPRVKIAKGSFDFNDFLWNPGSVANQMVKVGSSMFSRFHEVNMSTKSGSSVNEVLLSPAIEAWEEKDIACAVPPRRRFPVDVYADFCQGLK